MGVANGGGEKRGSERELLKGESMREVRGEEVSVRWKEERK